LARASDARAQLDLLHRFVADRTARTPESWVGVRVGAARLDQVIRELERETWGAKNAAFPRERVLAAVDEALGGGL
jgi:hypothetical protein